MGIDFLDCIFRIDKEFKLRQLDGRKLDVPCDKKGRYLREVTPADVLRLVQATLASEGKEIPADLWPRVRKCIADTVRLSPDEVKLESRMVADLGFS